MEIKAFAPASVGNFLIGFDALGMALENTGTSLLGDIVTITESKTTEIVVTGAFAHKVPSNPHDNIITHCAEVFHKHMPAKKKSFTMTLEKRLPVGSGLGSSGSSINAALFALNAFYEHVFSKEALLLMAGEMEGIISGDIHYDNVAPSLFGGLQLMLPQAPHICDRLPMFADWYYVIHYPGIEMTTRYAREILPPHYSLAAASIYWQRLAAFIHALHTQNKSLAMSQLQDQDQLIELHRAALVPQFDSARRAAVEQGALAFGLSGSGSSCLAISTSMMQAQAIQRAITDAMPPHKESLSWICTMDTVGARLI